MKSQKQKRKSKEQATGKPVVSIRNSYVRIFPLAQEKIYAEPGKQVDIMEDEGSYYIAVLPDITSNREGGLLHRSHDSLQCANSIISKGIEAGHYEVLDPMFDEGDGIDWYRLEKLN